MIEMHGLRFHYPASAGPALGIERLTVPPGTVLAALGATGSGKSTLAALLGGLAPAMLGGHLEGQLSVLGRDPASASRRVWMETVGVVFQDPWAGLSGAAETVSEEVAFGLENLGVAPELMRLRVGHALQRVGLESLSDRAVVELSGGQVQRVALAAVLALAPPVIVLDEPASWLDPAAAETLADLVASLAADGHTVVWTDQATHPVLGVAHQVWALGKGAALTVPEALAAAPDLGLREPLFVRAARVAGVPLRASREAVLEDLRAHRG